MIPVILVIILSRDKSQHFDEIQSEADLEVRKTTAQESKKSNYLLIDNNSDFSFALLHRCLPYL